MSDRRSARRTMLYCPHCARSVWHERQADWSAGPAGSFTCIKCGSVKAPDKRLTKDKTEQDHGLSEV